MTALKATERMPPGKAERDLEVGDVPDPAAGDLDEVRDTLGPEERRDAVGENPGDE